MFAPKTARLAAAAQAVNDHSAMVAAAARESAGRTDTHAAFVAGMLHDIGKLALATVLGDRYLAIEDTHAGGVERSQAELAAFGATHAEVGGYLLQLWGLPYQLVDAVARHHDPGAAEDPNPLLAAVAAALHEGDTPPAGTGGTGPSAPTLVE
jgi:putative nucleotidyltransferase with HDIG domain